MNYFTNINFRNPFLLAIFLSILVMDKIFVSLLYEYFVYCVHGNTPGRECLTNSGISFTEIMKIENYES